MSTGSQVPETNNRTCFMTWCSGRCQVIKMCFQVSQNIWCIHGLFKGTNNSPGMRIGSPYTSSAGVACRSSFQTALSPSKTAGKASNQVSLWHSSAALSCLCRRSTKPLEAGWYGVVQRFSSQDSHQFLKQGCCELSSLIGGDSRWYSIPRYPVSN